MITHATPSDANTRNADRQLINAITPTTSSGVNAPPQRAPIHIVACARVRSRAGNHTLKAFVKFGKHPASPTSDPLVRWARFGYVARLLFRASHPPMSDPLSRQRRWTSPQPGDTLGSIAARELPKLAPEAGAKQLGSWNLHLVIRPLPGLAPGELLGSDVVYLEPPLAL